MSWHRQKGDRVGDEIMAAIMRGDYDRVPREEDLAEAFGVSRGTVRSAVQGLVARDVLEVTHGRPGARVRPLHDWDLLDASILGVVLDSPLRTEVLPPLLEIRSLVVPPAAALAAERATLAETADLERRLAAAGPDLDFHRGVIDAARNGFIARIAMPLELALARRFHRKRNAVKHQAAMLQAIQERNADDARDAMLAWLDSLDTRAPAR